MAEEGVSMVEAEACVVGSILLDAGSFGRVSEYLRPDSFQLETYRAIFVAAGELAAAGRPIDPLTVQDQAAKDGIALERNTLFQCMDLTITSANDIEYAKIVADRAMRRELRLLAERILEDVGTPARALLERVSGQLDIMTRSNVGGRCLGSQEAMGNFLQVLSERAEGKKNVVSSGYPKLDKLLGGGFLKSGLYILAARPGMGKTTVALNLADQIEGSVLFVSLEMSAEQIAAKRVARKAGMTYHRLLNGELRPEDESDWAKVAEATTALAKSGVVVNKALEASVTEIGLMARSVKNLSAVIVDYLGLIRPSKKGSRYEEVSAISGDLKRLAVALNVPVIALCQLSRAAEQRQDKRPNLADLRDSGSIEQDADGVLLLYRGDYYEESADRKAWQPSLIECSIAKNRHAGTGKVYFNGYLPVCRVEEI